MAQNTGATAAEQIETIVVDADDIVETIRRNARDRDEQRKHVLRVSPPFEGRKRAKPHVSDDHAHYPSEMNPKPIHIWADAFHDTEFGYPETWEVHEAAMEQDGVDNIADVSDETLEECWDVHIEVWESEVRASLVDEVTFQIGTADGLTDVTLPVEIEG
jgi:hypothetical protein